MNNKIIKWSKPIVNVINKAKLEKYISTSACSGYTGSIKSLCISFFTK